VSGGGFRGEDFLALGEAFGLLAGGEGEDVACPLGEFGEGEGVGGAEFGLPGGVAVGRPALGGDPVDAGHVGRGLEAVELQQLVVALRAGGVADDALGVLVEVEQSEHLAAEGLVAYPEDEVLTPLFGFYDVRQREEVGASAFGVHGGSIRAVSGEW
jgi:hypothetical protein